jgi:hypothetical protein
MISKIEIERRPKLDRELPGITEAAEGGWGINRHANTGAEIVAASRRARKFRAN